MDTEISILDLLNGSVDVAAAAPEGFPVLTAIQVVSSDSAADPRRSEVGYNLTAGHKLKLTWAEAEE